MTDVPTALLPAGVTVRYQALAPYPVPHESSHAPGEFTGSRGQSQALRGFVTWLEGPAAQYRQLRYYCHIQNVGDTRVLSSGEPCFAPMKPDFRLEGMQLWLEALQTPAELSSLWRHKLSDSDRERFRQNLLKNAEFLAEASVIEEVFDRK